MSVDNEYLPYFLTGNPFPSDPSFNKDSSNKRVNGEIFNEEIFKDELDKLHLLMKRRVNLVYCQNMADFVRGVGKSSIIAHAWRTLQNADESISSVFIRCQRKSTPNMLSAEVINEWHRQGLLWKTLINCLRRYVGSEPAPEIASGGVQKLAERKWPIDSIDLRAYLVFSAPRLINSLTEWAVTRSKSLSNDVTTFFFDYYLKSPRSFLTEYPKILRKTRKDEIELLRHFVELMDLAGFSYHYIFLDQFEDPIHGLAGKDLIAFSSGMRRILELGNERMTVVVTLHPGAVLTLEGQDSQEFTTLAPLDSRHRIDVDLLNPEDAQALAITYLEAFRTDSSPDPLYPFTPEAIAQIFEATKGQIRSILSGLNLAIEEGVEAGCPVVDQAFIQSKHVEITGKLHPDLINL